MASDKEANYSIIAITSTHPTEYQGSGIVGRCLASALPSLRGYIDQYGRFVSCMSHGSDWCVAQRADQQYLGNEAAQEGGGGVITVRFSVYHSAQI